jgi:hypothetical protein
MNAFESFTFSGLSGNSATFNTKIGGLFSVSVVGTFSSTSVILQQLCPDGLTYAPVPNVNGSAAGFAANGAQNYLLPRGTFRFAITATGVSISVMRCPKK